MTSPKTSLTITSHREARELAEAFGVVRDSEAWNKLRRFVAFMQLQAGQRALNRPEEVLHWKSWSEGVGFILTIVDDAMEQVEVYEEAESAQADDNDQEILEFLDTGGAGNSDPL